MPTNKLVCPHCGHDGTPETSRPPLGSYGFNYLAEGLVCREVKGFDENGRLLLSGDFKCEGAQGSGARFECRVCWRTFPAPEGLSWAVTPEPASVTAGASEPGSSLATGLEDAAETISRSLLSLLHTAVDAIERATSGELSRLEVSISSLKQAVEEAFTLKSEVAGLRDQAGSAAATLAALQTALSEAQLQLQALAPLPATLEDRMLSLERKHQEDNSAVAGRIDELEKRLSALAAQSEAALEAIGRRLDAQAEAIRVLHAAVHEQLTRREELRAAVQRLEQIAGGLEHIQPLPKEL